jgi:hypothetical protein
MSAVSFFDIVASWPEPNYVDPETRGNGIIVASILFGLLGTIATALRLYTRLFITRTFGLDDAFIIAAWVRFFFLVLGRSQRIKSAYTGPGLYDSYVYPDVHCFSRVGLESTRLGYSFSKLVGNVAG